MAFIPITRDHLENVTLVLHPQRHIMSSSTGGVTGTINLVERPSVFIKNIPEDTQNSPGWSQGQIISSTKAASLAINQGTTDVSSLMSTYLADVNAQVNPSRNSIFFAPVRYRQPVNFSDDYNGSPYLMKRIITENLMPFYRHGYSTSDFSCGNYHTLNFFSSSAGPNNSAIIYANTSSLGRPYTPDGAFSIDFYINPRYKFSKNEGFVAGTILHLSSTFALSLVSGSSLDNNQLGDGYRLLLQLSQSADTSPSSLDLAAVESGLSYPNNLAFITPDNSLKHNCWHHVTVRWGTNTRSYGSGSIFIDSSETSFAVPSSSRSTKLTSDALIVGNYFKGADYTAKFFNSTISPIDGIPLITGFSTDPVNFTFSNPLQAEIHDLKLYKRFLSSADISKLAAQSNSSDKDLLLYVPPVFSSVTNTHDVLVTPFQTVNKVTSSPFNVDMALSVNGFYMNLENFVRDLVTGQSPRLYNLTASMITSSFDMTADAILYQNRNVAKRNLTILPNDNGLQFPDFTAIESEASDFFKNDLGNVSHGIISMRNVASTSSYYAGLPADFNALGGATPEDPTVEISSALTIAQRFKDTGSNLVLIFDLTTLGFGRKIQPGSYTITDINMSGSYGKVSISLSDDNNGTIYRSDCLTPHAKWNSVGNIFYVEGTSMLTNPALALFGKEQFDLTLTGEQRTNVFIVNAPAPSSLINSSSNSSFEPFPVSENINERENEFVYITGINLHDENLNVIMRANLAQPVAKRNSDEFLFRLKYDF